MFSPPPLRRTLAAALRDQDSPKKAVRISAVRDLAHHGDEAREEVVRALEKALRDEDAEVRATAALGLADVEGAEALSSLLVAVEDEDAYVRQMALTAIGELRDPRATERLRRALGDPRPEVRFQAVIAFGRVAPDEAPGALAQALDDDDASIRYIGLRVAEEHAETEGIEVPRLVCARARQLLDDREPRVRIAAAIVLARAGDPAGAAVLEQVVAGTLATPELEDEATAVELAGELSLSATKPALERRAFGLRRFTRQTFAWQAKVSLARMGHAKARAEILRDLLALSRDKRTLAVAAAGRAHLVEARSIIESMRGREEAAEPSAVEDALAVLDEPGAPLARRTAES